MAGGVFSYLSLLVGSMLVASVTSEAIMFKYNIGVSGASSIAITLTATDEKHELAGTGLWKMSAFVSQADNPDDLSGAKAYIKQALTTAEQDQSVHANQELTFKATLQYSMANLGGCENDYKFVCVAFGKGEKPDPQFDLLNVYKACLNLGGKCLGDSDKPVLISGLQWGLASDGTFTAGIDFHESSRQNLEGTGLWKLMVGWTKEDNPTSTDYLDQKDVLSAEQSGTSLVNGQSLSFSAPYSYDQSSVGCGESQYRYICVVFGQGASPKPSYSVSEDIGSCKLVYTCDEF